MTSCLENHDAHEIGRLLSAQFPVGLPTGAVLAELEAAPLSNRRRNVGHPAASVPESRFLSTHSHVLQQAIVPTDISTDITPSRRSVFPMLEALRGAVLSDQIQNSSTTAPSALRLTF